MWGRGKRLCAPIAVDPVVARAEQTQQQLTIVRAELAAGAPEREKVRAEAEAARLKAQELLQRNHFGESMEYAMRRRGV